MSLKNRAVTAGTWVLFGYLATLMLRLSSNLVMTRLLSPDAFGIMAVASVFQVVVALLADLGIRQAIIQSPNGDKESFLNTAWTIQVVRGAIIWGACAVGALVLHSAQVTGWLTSESVYSNPNLPTIIAAVSFTSVIAGFHSMKSIVLDRQLDLWRTTLIDLTQMVVGIAVAIYLGWLTRSVWSFVASTFAGSLITVILSRYWLPGRKDRFEWNPEAVQELVRFGRWVLLSSAIGVVAMNGDRLMLAAWTTPVVLGYYSIASNLALVIEGTASRIFASVSLPALSEIARHQPHRFREIYFRMRWLSDILFLSMSGFLFAAGGGVVKILFDARYSPAGEMLQWLSLSLIFSRYGLAQNAYIALGRPSYITVVNVAKVISLFVIVPSLYYFFGVKGAIVGIAVQLCPVVPIIYWLNRRHQLNSLALEIGVLVLWPVGWFAGKLVVAALNL